MKNWEVWRRRRFAQGHSGGAWRERVLRFPIVVDIKTRIPTTVSTRDWLQSDLVCCAPMGIPHDDVPQGISHLRQYKQSVMCSYFAHAYSPEIIWCKSRKFYRRLCWRKWSWATVPSWFKTAVTLRPCHFETAKKNVLERNIHPEACRLVTATIDPPGDQSACCYWTLVSSFASFFSGVYALHVPQRFTLRSHYVFGRNVTWTLFFFNVMNGTLA